MASAKELLRLRSGMMAFDWWWFAIMLAAPASAGLTLRSYENSGFEGTPNEVVLRPRE